MDTHTWTTLPAELMHHTFGYLSDDKASLKSCSLVCAAWEPLTGPYLFRHLYINCKALVFVSPEPSYSTLQPAYFTIKNSFRITRHIQVVTLTDNDGYGDNAPKTWACLLDEIPLAILAHIVFVFPALRTLHVVDLVLANMCDPRISFIDFSVPERRRIERVDLQFVPQTFFSTTLEQFLSLFEEVDQLYIEDRWRPGCSPPGRARVSGTDRPTVLPPRVHSLTLRNRGDSDLVADVLQVLSKAAQTGSLTLPPKHLALSDYRPTEHGASAVNKYLLENAGGLESFEYDVASSSVIAAAHRAMMSEAGTC